MGGGHPGRGRLLQSPEELRMCSVSSRCLVKQEWLRDIVVGWSFRGSRGWEHGEFVSRMTSPNLDVRKILLEITGKTGTIGSKRPMDVRR